MKKEYIFLGAAALIGAYVLMPKGEESGPGSSGGLGAGLGGLPGIPGTGGGGSDSPTVNIDFPAFPAIVFPDEPPAPGETKKEAAVADASALPGTPSWYKAAETQPLSSLNTTGLPPWEVEGLTKKEAAITSVWDLRLFGKTTEQQKAIAPSLFQKTAPRTETFSKSSKLYVNKSPTPVQWSTSGLTKKESSTSSSSGSGTSTNATRATPAPAASAGGPIVSFMNNQGRFF